MQTARSTPLPQTLGLLQTHSTVTHTLVDTLAGPNTHTYLISRRTNCFFSCKRSHVCRRTVETCLWAHKQCSAHTQRDVTLVEHHLIWYCLFVVCSTFTPSSTAGCGPELGHTDSHYTQSPSHTHAHTTFVNQFRALDINTALDQNLC